MCYVFYELLLNVNSDQYNLMQSKLFILRQRLTLKIISLGLGGFGDYQLKLGLVL